MIHAYRYRLFGWKYWATVICPDATCLDDVRERLAWRFGAERVEAVEPQSGGVA